MAARARSRLRTPVYGAPGNSETTALVARMATYPGAQRVAQIDTLIGSLKSGGVWAKLDALYVFSVHETATAVLNWVSTNYGLTGATPPTFTPGQYVQGNGTTQFYDTNFNPTTASTPKFVQDSAHIGAWQVNTVTSAVMGHTGATLIPGTGPTFRLNGAVGITGSGAAAAGYVTAVRGSASSLIGYYNGVENINSGANTSAAPSAETFYICARNQTTDSFSQGRLTIVHFGQSLTAGEVTSAYNAFQTYLRAVGAI